MPYARIWYEPASVKITYFVEGSDPDQAVNILLRDGHVNRAATFEDVESRAELDLLIPTDRSQRNRWIKAPGRRGVIVRPAVVP